MPGTTSRAGQRRRAAARLLAPLPVRRRGAGWVAAIGGTGALTAVFTATRTTFGQGSHFLLYQLVVLVAAVLGGAAPAVTAAVFATAALNWFFTPPLYTWTIHDGENVLALVVFVAVGVFVGFLVTALARRSADARRARREAEALARVAAGMVAAEDPLPPMLEHIRSTLGLHGISVHSTPQAPALAAAGVLPDPRSSDTSALAGGTVLISGPLGGVDDRVLEAFTAQLTATLERRTLREEADRAHALAAADALRTAILRAVSHDLRTPLASIKASVTSLLQRDIVWHEEAQREFLSTIDEEADRLDTVIGNLLDASRLEAGAIQPVKKQVALDDVVPTALSSISGLRAAVDLDLPPNLPLVHADPGLLERAIANLVANADGVTPTDGRIRVTANALARTVELRIVDHGPGVPHDQRESMFQPFQRLGDTAAGTGVGLGLAVARGIIDAMNGGLSVEDTPDGGLTMVASLPRVHDG